jgi:hypothetical protein
MLDVLIKGSRIADGTGAAIASGDIGIVNGKIASVGGRNSETAKRVIDAAAPSSRQASSICTAITMARRPGTTRSVHPSPKA